MRKVLGIILVLVMFVSFTGCDLELTSVSGFSNEQLLEIAGVGLAVAALSPMFYDLDSSDASNMMTAKVDEKSLEISWNNFDFQKVLKQTGLDFGELSEYNVIIQSGSMRINSIDNTVKCDFRYSIEDDTDTATFQIYAYMSEYQFVLKVNGHLVDTSGLSPDDFGL